jgi:hypothetical protein
MLSAEKSHYFNHRGHRGNIILECGQRTPSENADLSSRKDLVTLGTQRSAEKITPKGGH